jgi:hypothetical protein
MSLDPELALMLQTLRNLPAFETLSVAEARALVEEGREAMPPGVRTTVLSAGGCLP